MSVIPIQQPLLDGGIRSVNFFNGRLLSGEDLSAEQAGNLTAHARLGMSIGTGIVNGLTVTQPPPPLPGADSDPNPLPKVTVSKGMAINAQGQTLFLYNDTDVQLVNTSSSSSTTSSQGTFRSAQPAPSGQYTMGEGIYLLTIAPAQGSDGLSPVSTFSNSGATDSTATCNIRFTVEAVQFQLIQLKLSGGLLSDTDHLRNKIAYACFGFTDQSPQTLPLPPDTFGPAAHNTRLFEALQLDLSDNVPLAILSWSSTGNLNFIDAWSVRRRLIHSAFTSRWWEALGDQRLAEAEAMFLQFQSQIDDLQLGVAVARQNAATAQGGQPTTNPLSTLSADQVFSYLPAAGYLPVGKDSFDWKTFLGPLAPDAITCVDSRFFRLLLHNSFFETPIKVGPYADGTASGEAQLDVYQDASQPHFVLFARSNTGRVLVTVNAQGYQPANLFVSFTVGQQAQVTIPLKSDNPQAEQRPVSVDIEEITRPALHRVRLSIIQQPAKSSDVLSNKIPVDPLPQNVVDWLNNWKTWLNNQYPNQGIDCSTPAIYMNDYYTPPQHGNIPEDPAAYAVFGAFAVPLLIMLRYYTTPLPVPLAKAGIQGLTDDIIQGLAGEGIFYIDQVVGAWSKLIAQATGQSDDFGRYLVEDALRAVAHFNTTRRYYEGFNDTVEEVLEQMALSDDVSLANAAQDELGENLHSVGFALRLIIQARKAVLPTDWSLEPLGFTPAQIAALQQISISSKGEFAKKADDGDGHKQLENILQQSPQAIDQLHAKAIQQMTASSLAQARIKDLILLPNVNAEVATKLAEANINTTEDVHKTSKEELMQIAGLSEDAAEDLKKEAKEAGKEGLEVVKLASVTKDVANVLDTVLQVRTISHLLELGEDKVAEALKATHADRAVHFVKALFDGIAGAGR